MSAWVEFNKVHSIMQPQNACKFGFYNGSSAVDFSFWNSFRFDRLFSHYITSGRMERMERMERMISIYSPAIEVSPIIPAALHCAALQDYFSKCSVPCVPCVPNRVSLQLRMCSSGVPNSNHVFHV